MYNNLIILHQFLDATAAFDKCLQEIILREIYLSGVDSDAWNVIEQMHKKAEKVIKWQGLTSEEKMQETRGTRQGGHLSADEFKIYVNNMLIDLEGACGEDRLAGLPASVVGLADDTAPTSSGRTAREAVHNLQPLLFIVQQHGVHLHLQFGVDKCKLLITAKPHKLKSVENLLKSEPNILTFFDSPVSLVEEFYVHLGVPQAPRHQSKIIVDYRLGKAMDLVYLMQDVTKNAFRGINPISNSKIFTCYNQPTFLYGLDTIDVGSTELDRLERKYRSVLKRILSVPDQTSTSGIYLNLGICPGYAQRDLDIMGLLGQLALSPDNLQSVTIIIKDHLTEYPMDFPGWSGLARRTAAKYGLPDPLQYLEYPWRPDRWREHCKEIIFAHWETILKDDAKERPSLELFDVNDLSISKPHRLWEAAGRTSAEVTKACIVNWMLMGVFLTRDQLFKYKKVQSPNCNCCDPEQSSNIEETLFHHLLFCHAFTNIRKPYMERLTANNPNLIKSMDNQKIITISILDPESKLLPNEIRENWHDKEEAYRTARDFVFNLFKKRKLLTDEFDKKLGTKQLK